MKIVARHGMRHDSEQRFCEFVMIIRELLRQLPRSRVQRNAIARRQKPQRSVSPNHGQTPHRPIERCTSSNTMETNRCGRTTALPLATSALDEEPSAALDATAEAVARLGCLHAKRRNCL